MISEDVITRLSQSKTAYYQRQHAQGSLFGREWAIGEASFEDLLRLSELDPTLAYSRDDINEAIDREHDDVFGEERTPDAFLIGFLSSTRQVWREVEARL